jgi:hypothetical protein
MAPGIDPAIAESDVGRLEAADGTYRERTYDSIDL